MPTVADLTVNLSANTTQLSQGFNRARADARNFSSGISGDLTGKLTPAIQNAVYAVDDFVAGWQNRGLQGGIQGAANNISALGLQLGGLTGLLIGVGISTGATIFAKIMAGAETAESSVDKLQKSLERMRDTLNQPMELKVRAPSVEELQQGVKGIEGEQAAKRAEKNQVELGQRQINQKLLGENAATLNAQREKLSDALSKELGMNLGGEADILKVMREGKFNQVHGQTGWTDFLLARNDVLDRAKRNMGIKVPDIDKVDMSDDQQARLKELLQLTRELNKENDKATDNALAIERLKVENEILSKKKQGVALGADLFAQQKGILGGLDMANAKLPGALGNKLAIQAKPMMPEGWVANDLNASLRERQEREDKLLRQRTGFAGAAEKGSLEAARIFLNAMAHSTEQEALKEAKKQTAELKKIGVTLNAPQKKIGVIDTLTA